MTFTTDNITFVNALDGHRDKATTKVWTEAIEAVKAGSKCTITGGECEAEGSVVVTINDRLWFYCDKVTIN